MPTRSVRRFHAYCTGLPKTGTTSVCTVFGRYRSAKVGGSELELRGGEFRDGRLSREDAESLLRKRDEQEWLELDASSANWMFASVLPTLFPDAKFIVTIRDCFSWLDSMLNVVIARDIGPDFLEDPDRFRALLDCELEWFRNEDSVVQHREVIVARLLRFWSRQADTLAASPPERALVVRTSEISSSLDRIAELVGVPLDTLIPERSHSRRTDQKFNMLQRLDRDFLERAFESHARSELMRKYYPDATLAGFLSARADRRAPSGHAASDAPDAGRDAEGRGHTPRSVPESPESAVGYARVVAAVVVVVAHAEHGGLDAFEYRLKSHSVTAHQGVCHAILTFQCARRDFTLELGLRDATPRYWLASKRYAVSYRKDTAAPGNTEKSMVQSLLEALERGTPDDGAGRDGNNERK